MYLHQHLMTVFFTIFVDILVKNEKINVTKARQLSMHGCLLDSLFNVTLNTRLEFMCPNMAKAQQLYTAANNFVMFYFMLN